MAMPLKSLSTLEPRARQLAVSYDAGPGKEIEMRLQI
jgi:hypothetical protein